MKFQTLILQALALAHLSQSTKIYVSSYSGNITTVLVTPQTGGNLTLRTIARNAGCSPSPSWLTLDNNTSTLYCADEGLTGNQNISTFSSFSTSENGTLSLISKITTLNSNVYMSIYGKDSLLRSLSSNGGSAITLVNISNPSSLTPLQETNFVFQTPVYENGKPVHPYIHQTLLDPTQQYLLAPDLTADIIHVFAITPSYTIQKSPTQNDISVPAGHGPRHGVFYNPNGGNATYLYVLMETASMVHAYQVLYNGNGTLGFNFLQDFQLPVPATGATGAEIALTPDNNFLIVSSRNDTNFSLPNLDPNNSTNMLSDSLFTFSLSSANGSFSLLQRSPAYGLAPRQFSISKNGTMVAVALNTDNRLVVIGRNVSSGLMEGIVGYLDLDVGNEQAVVTSAVWDECEDEGEISGPVDPDSIIASLLGTSLMSAATPTGEVDTTVTISPSSTSAEATPTGNVSVAPSTTSGGSASGSGSAMGSATSTPSPIQAGMVGDCTQFHLVVSGDTCSSIVAAANISVSNFYLWNPGVGSSCATLFADDWVCIAVAS